MNRINVFLILFCAISLRANPVEFHMRLPFQEGAEKRVVLTLDACSGGFDEKLIDFLIQNKIHATIFLTKKWISQNRQGASILKSHQHLFDIENHGANHIPPVIGLDKKVYGIPGEPDMAHMRDEVENGAQAITDFFGIRPKWYRGATAKYDPAAIQEILKMGFKIGGFSVNADQGATLSETAVTQNVAGAKNGDIIIAHMNKPFSQTYAGLSKGLKALLERGFEFKTLKDF